MDFIGTSINYDDNSEGVNFKDDYWITKYHLFNQSFAVNLFNFREKPAFIGDFLYTEAGSIDIPWDFSQAKVISLCLFES